MPISAKELDLGASIEQLRQQFNNLVSDVTTLQASPTYGNALIFEGTSQDDYETTFTVLDPTADRVIYLPNSDGTLLMDTATITASLSTIIANNSTNETVYPVFVDTATGDRGLESDTGFTWNPSTNVLTIGSAVIADAGTIGSASDTNAIAISAAGLVTLSATASLSVTGTSTFNEDVTFTGAANNAVWDKSDNALEFADSAKAIFGTGGDLEIYHDGSHSYISDQGTGNFRLQGSQIDLQGGTDGAETMATFVDNGAVTLYHDNSAKLATSAAGVSVTGTATMSANVVIADDGNIGSASDTDAIAISAAGVVTFSQTPVFSSDLTLGDDLFLDSDSGSIYFGDDAEVRLSHVHDQGLRLNDTYKMMFGNSDDLKIYHDGTDSRINDAGTGGLIIQSNQTRILNAAASETIADFTENGAVTLYHDNSAKLATSAAGVSVTGTATMSGNVVIADDGQIGSASDTDAITINSSGVVTLSQNLIITGDLTVNGTTTTVSTSNTVVGDSLIELNSGAGSNANDLGLVMERGSTGDNVLFVWDESGDHFSVGTTTATGASTGNLTYTLANFSAASIVGTLATAAQSNITSLGTLTTLTVDNVIINGTDIGHTSDTDLLGLASGVLTVRGRTDVTGSIYLTGDEKHVRWYNGSNYVNLGASSSLSSNLTFTLPTADGSSGQALVTDASGNLSFAANNVGNATTSTISANNSTDETVYPVFVDGATGEQGLETDTALSYNPSTGLLSTAGITLTGALTVAGTTTLNGALVLGDAAADALTINATTTVNENMTFTDGDKAIFGTGGDLEIYHSGTHSLIQDAGTGNLYIDSQSLWLRNYSDSASMAVLTGGGAVQLFNNGSEKFTTTSTGISVTGGIVGSDNMHLRHDGVRLHFGVNDDVYIEHIHDTGLRMPDGDKLNFGDSDDLSIYHDGSNSALTHSGTGDFYVQSDQFYFRSSSTSENMITGTVNGSVVLFYNGNQHFTTNSSGGALTGNWSVTDAFVPDAADGATLGTAALEFSDLFLADSATIQFGNDQEIILTHVPDSGIRLHDSDKMMWGDGNDLQIYHDGSNSYIDEASGTGSLIVKSNQFIVRNAAGSENMFDATQDGAVNLYYDSTAVLTTVSGGVNVTGGMTITDNVHLDHDGVILHFGDDNDITLTHVHDTGLLLNSTKQLQFNDASQYICGASATQLDIRATDEIELTATTIDLNGNLDVSGTVTCASPGATLLIKNSSGGTLKTIKGMT